MRTVILGSLKFDLILKGDLVVFKTPAEWIHSYNGFEYRCTLRLQNGIVEVAFFHGGKAFPYKKWEKEIKDDLPKWWATYLKKHPRIGKLGEKIYASQTKEEIIASLQKQVEMMKQHLDNIQNQILQLSQIK